MKNTFIVNEDFFDSLSKKLFYNFTCSNFEYKKVEYKEIQNLTTKVVSCFDRCNFILTAKFSNTNNINFILNFNVKKNENICQSVLITIVDNFKHAKWFKECFCTQGFDEKTLNDVVINNIILYKDAVISKEEKAKLKFKETFNFELFMEEK